jgi:hypothetical protein
VAYLVCGWYARAALDPLNGLDESTFWPLLETFGWSLAPDLPGAEPVPETCLFHGSAVSIGWPTPRWVGGGALGAEDDARPAADDVVTAVGDTIAAAVAALGVEPGSSPPQTGRDDMRHRLLESAVSGATERLDRPDWPARLDAALHRARFGHHPGRPVTEVVWQPLITRPTSPTGPTGGPDPGGLDPGGIGNALTIPPLIGGFRRVQRPGPRTWHPLDPAVVLQGAGRGFRHGGDGRFDPTGHLRCRASGSTVRAVGVVPIDIGAGAAVLPDEPLGGLSVPAECADLTVELAATDPGSAPDIAVRAAGPSALAAARATLWLFRDPGGPPPGRLAVLGALPDPLAITPPGRPWSPYRLDWSLGYLPSGRGIHDWGLADLDFEPQVGPPPPAQPPERELTGSTTLTAHAATLAQAATGVGAPLDLLSGAVADLAARLRAEPLNPVVQPLGSQHTNPDDPPPDAPVLALRAGWLRLDRLRLVDGFGRFLDLLPGPGPVARSRGLLVPGRPDLLTFVPRYTAPARVSFRLTDGTGGPDEAVDGLEPVAGYLLASPLDGSIEVFDVTGGGLGRLRPDPTSVTVWEPEPGTGATVGRDPAALVNSVLRELVGNVLSTDQASARSATPRTLPALEALRRVLDVTRWAVDEVGAAGEEHLGLLLGHPVAVVRAHVDVEVEDPRRPREIARTAIPMRLGVLGHLQDGLLAYFVADDHSRLRVVDPAVAELAAAGDVLPGYVDRMDAFAVQPGSGPALTLLMVPGSQVHVTCGLLPRKAITLQRAWTAGALARLSPTVRHGPVLRDPAATRLPVTGRVRGTWRWHRRVDPATWATDQVVATTDEALLPTGPLSASDGWLQLLRGPDPDYGSDGLAVTCVRTTTGPGEPEIVAVGVDNLDGSHVLVPAAQAAALIETRAVTLHAQRAGHPPVRLRAVRRPDGSRRIGAVGGLDDLLLDLPRCGP